MTRCSAANLRLAREVTHLIFNQVEVVIEAATVAVSITEVPIEMGLFKSVIVPTIMSNKR